MNYELTILGQTRLCIGRVSTLLDSLLPHGRTIIITDATIDRLYPDLVHRTEHIINRFFISLTIINSIYKCTSDTYINHARLLTITKIIL